MPVDNSFLGGKIALRRSLLEGVPDPSVLDLFCGSGTIYSSVYRDRVAQYTGVDSVKVHDRDLCELQDNASWVLSNDIGAYNVFDLDAYGSPWLLALKIAEKVGRRPWVLFATDGSFQHLSRTSDNRIARSILGIPKRMTVPGLGRWYMHQMAGILELLAYRTMPYKQVLHAHNSVKTHYWGVAFGEFDRV